MEEALVETLKRAEEFLGRSWDDPKLVDTASRLNPARSGIAPNRNIREHAEALIEERGMSVWTTDPPVGSLPVLKVPDPAFLIDRLENGELAGLLSKKRRSGRVGKPQALVNELGPLGLGKTLIWGVVVQNAPKAIDVPNLSKEVVAGIDSFTSLEFFSETDAYWLELGLVVKFDPPLELRGRATGRRFGSTVDFEKDVVPGRKIRVDDLIRNRARATAVGFAADPDPKFLAELPRARLMDLDEAVVRTFRSMFEGNARSRVDSVDRIDVLRAHEMIVAELKRRGLPRLSKDTMLDELLSLASADDALGASKIEKRFRPVTLLKVDKEGVGEERFVFGVVLVPNVPDAHQEVYSEEDVRKAAHYWMEHGGGTNKIMHRGRSVEDIIVLETYVSKQEEEHGGEILPKGTWFLGVRVKNDKIWGLVKNGTLTGFSIGGTALRESLLNVA